MIKIKLKSYSNPLEEGRVDDMKKKYPGKDDLVDEFSKAPGNNKYLDWMMAHSDEASPEDMMSAIKKFHKHANIPEDKELDSKDINLYSDFKSLKDNLSEIRPPKRELERTGTQFLYNDEEFSIIRPTNKEASCKHGVNTKWCIAATKTKNYFGQYARGGAYHYFLKIKNLPSEDPRHHIAYTLVPTKTDKPSVEIYDATDKIMDRRAVVYAIYSAVPEPSTPEPGDSNFLNYDLGPGDDDFESDYADARSDERSAEEKEEKLFQIMISDFQNKVASDPGDRTDEHYFDLNDQTTNQNTSWDVPDRVASIIYQIFYDNDLNTVNSEPRFVKKHIKKLMAMNNEYVDKYFIKAFDEPRPNRIARAINANITPEQKSELIKRVEGRRKERDDYHKKRVNELADYIFNDPRYKSTINILRQGGYDEFIDRTFQGFFQSYTEREVEDAIQIVFEKMNKEDRTEQSTNESKLFKFNKDKKMFKLLR